MSLFDDDTGDAGLAPLAERMRPRDLDEVAGQHHLLDPGKGLRQAIESDRLRSLILWGPPGSGKTTLARIVAARTRAEFVPFSAVLSGIKEVREVMQRAARLARASGRRTIVFVDEIHRFNKAQQDAFLPFVEEGTIVLIGATTENPSFEVISPLLSRARVYRLERLTEEELIGLLRRALDDDERGLGGAGVEVEDEALLAIARLSQGDARAALNSLELAVHARRDDEGSDRRLDRAGLEDLLARQLYHDKSGEEHFNLISALHKSMRNSDPDATLYWLGRMLEAGDDPMYVVRRIVRFASEDVGLADPRALTLSIAARDAVHFVGRPEADLAIAQAAVFCALAPKSNALYRAWGEVRKTIRSGPTDPVPMQLRNAPTGLMKAEGYGRGYEYAHDREDAVTGMSCLPESLEGRRFYRPTDRGLEAELGKRIEGWLTMRKKDR